MPTYTYACTECGHAFDIRQSFTDDPLTDCPECAEGRLRKVIHPVGIAFKGSGFYKTDSRASGSGSSASAAKSTDAKSGDTKPAQATTTEGTSTAAKPAASGGSAGSAGSGAAAASTPS
ncbi:FmdB family transcriptional regulator [Intrasporangium calvum]|uniref:FmdB family transcriptional regulator n=1 Tax=Intrasporangium calvum TaxID=53358 RepID=A0ABT5GJC1_9MICO|nr:FmdB family zinc ribbon protein [Intrasporangium calvum]MDC5698193.1 FmdB family transcriptional regulator [Intrasporangium calvum]